MRKRTMYIFFIPCLLVLTLLGILLLPGCTRKDKGPDDPPTSSKIDSGSAGSDAASSVTESSGISSGEASGQQSQAPAGSPAGSAISWRKDITIEEPYTPAVSLSEQKLGEISISADRAVPVPIYLTIEESVQNLEDVRSGDVSTEVSLASLEPSGSTSNGKSAVGWGSEPGTCEGIRSFLNDWNKRAQGRAETELSEGLARYAAYRQIATNDFSIYLNSWISLQVGRSDTQLFSCIEEVYRYNRGYEADYYEIHGKTINSTTGEPLSLLNFFTDIDLLCEKAAQMLLLSGSLPRDSQVQEAMAEYVKSAIKSCRDDGSFAWMVTPEGIEFHLICLNSGTSPANHYNAEFFLPFSACQDFLSQDTCLVSYPYLQWVSSAYVPLILGGETPSAPDGSSYYQLYLGQTGVHKYLYGCDNEHTQIYKTDSGTGSLYSMGEILGEIAPVEYTYDRAYVPLDPQSVGIRCLVQLEQELFLKGNVRIRENGMLERIGLFELEGNGQPITTAIDLQAEVFPNETASESTIKTIPMHTVFAIIRSDGETFIDCQEWETEEVIRLYITGSEETGWLINGLPKENVIAHEGFWEE